MRWKWKVGRCRKIWSRYLAEWQSKERTTSPVDQSPSFCPSAEHRQSAYRDEMYIRGAVSEVGQNGESGNDVDATQDHVKDQFT